MRKLKNTLLNNPWMEAQDSKEILKYMGLSENKNATYQNLWDADKVLLREIYSTKC